MEMDSCLSDLCAPGSQESTPLRSSDVPIDSSENATAIAAPPELLFSNAEAASPSASVSPRVLPPVPKFTASGDSSSRPSKPSVLGRGLMGPPPVPKFTRPPPVPKFTDFSGDKFRVPGPPPPKGSQGLSGFGTSALEEVTQGAADSLSVSSVDRLEGNVGIPAADLNADLGETALVAGSIDDAVSGEGEGVALVEDESRRVGRPQSAADVKSGASSNLPYEKPPWSATPRYPYTVEVIKEGNSFGLVDVSQKGAYMFGRSDRCDFILEHPTVSRYHAVLQYNGNGESFLYDLGSTHGTFINKLQVKGKEYVPLHVGDILRFGFSSRLHAFQGPVNLMPKEGLSKMERQAQRVVDAVHDRAMREASLNRGKRDAMTSDGISWGMQEDAEEEEEIGEEITWQTFQGELTERQLKTVDKIHKHNEKLTNLKKETDAINAKETAQGGLTQGQQTQIARNDQRMAQLLEELESMEETLNESIQESISGRSGIRRSRKKKVFDEEDDDLSDDEFYDRASKLRPQKLKESQQNVETAESLLEKKAVLTREIENVQEAIKAEDEQNHSVNQETEEAKEKKESVDPLDQFMTHLSSNILKDRSSHLQKELDSLIKDLERVLRLLKIADPAGEAAKKWEDKRADEGNSVAETLNRIFPKSKGTKDVLAPVAEVNPASEQHSSQDGTLSVTSEATVNSENVKDTPSKEDTPVLPGLEPPLRLGAPMLEETDETKVEFSDKVNKEAVNFVTYKDRKKSKGDRGKLSVAEVAPKVQTPNVQDGNEDVEVHVADSVALLLRHKRGLGTADTDVFQDLAPEKNGVEEKPLSKKASKKRKKQGLAEGSHVTEQDGTGEWVPPAGQTGDGRTSLNDKYGY